MVQHPAGLLRLLVVVVAAEAGLAVAGAAGVVGGYYGGLAGWGLLGAVLLGLVALLLARRLLALGRQLDVQLAELADVAAAPRRLAAITHRTERLLADSCEPTIALQPIVDLATGAWVAVEALARFPDGVCPDQWFADAHQAGVGTALERRALESAIDLLPQLPPGVELSVNASPALVLDPAFGAVLARCGDAGRRLVIEITEHASVAHYDDISAALLPHRERGVRLAVDDTGAGYASFAHVLRLRPDVIKLDRSLLVDIDRLRPDVIKLDRSLLVDIDRDGARRAFVTAIVLMALELGARVTAEGVESAAELTTLATLGVDAVQGYLLARPSTDPAVWERWGARDWLAHTGPPVRWRSEPLGLTYGGRAPG